ncbi:MAG: transporter substrate-binding domain-containing protein, partial [Magnetococcales bacterium]|nr:transporter substrate-binding domain-containing protein [Magnetococcales bacterium]
QTLFQELTTNTFPSTSAMIEALTRGEVIGFIQEERITDAALSTLGLHGEITTRPERLFVTPVYAGVLKNRLALLSEINNGLARLTNTQLKTLESRWITAPEKRYFGRGVADAALGISPADRHWLDAHPVIRLGSDRGWHPYEFLDDQGRHQGLSAAFVTRIETILGVTFRPPESLAWSENIDRAKGGDLDILTAVASTPERREFLHFSKPYMIWPNVIATHAGRAKISRLEDLAGKRTGVVRGYAIEETLRREFPQANLLPQKDIAAGLLAVTTGTLDAFVDSYGTINHFSKKMLLDDIEVVAPTPFIMEIAFGVRKDWPRLVEIIDKTLAAIPPAERDRLSESSGLPSRVRFSEPTSTEPELVSPGEAILLALVIAILLGVIIGLAWLIRSQRKPFFQSLRGKSVLFITVALLLVGAVTVPVLYVIGNHISEKLGNRIAEQHALWHKEKVTGAITRELALARQMAHSQTVLGWVEDEDNPVRKDTARKELQHYRDNFKAQSFFVAVGESGHFYYTGENAKAVSLESADTLSRDDPDDGWFFSTMEDEAPFNVNIDHNTDLGVTNLWINYAMRTGGTTHGVVGTGVALTAFIDDFIHMDDALENREIRSMIIDSQGAIQAHVDPDMIAHNAPKVQSGDSFGIWNLITSESDRKTLRHHMEVLKKGEQEVATFFLELQGHRGLAAISYLAPLQWFTIAVFDTEELVSLQDKGTLAGVFFGGLLLTVFVIVFGQNLLIVRPLTALTRGAGRLSHGDFGVRLEVTQSDEIGELTETFNEMAATISRST